MQQPAKRILVIACGAIAREIQQLKLLNTWSHMTLQAIDATLHFNPQKIPAAVEQKIRDGQGKFEKIFVAYADCGTYGALDDVLARHNIERLPGVHCYATFAGQDVFTDLQEEEPGTFYLTDFLVRHFERLVVAALKIDRHPELRKEYFGNYTRLIYLAQTTDTKLQEQAQDIAAFLGLKYVHRFTGYGELVPGLQQFVMTQAL